MSDHDNNYDSYYGDPREPYFLEEDQGYGQCPECSSFLVNSGAVSDGDGDLYDELNCPLCQEQRGKHNLMWIDDDGQIFRDEGEFQGYGVFHDFEFDDDDNIGEGEFE